MEKIFFFKGNGINKNHYFTREGDVFVNGYLCHKNILRFFNSFILRMDKVPEFLERVVLMSTKDGGGWCIAQDYSFSKGPWYDEELGGEVRGDEVQITTYDGWTNMPLIAFYSVTLQFAKEAIAEAKQDNLLEKGEVEKDWEGRILLLLPLVQLALQEAGLGITEK